MPLALPEDLDAADALAALPAAVAAIAPSGAIVHANAALLALVGVPAAEIVGRPFSSLAPIDARPLLADALAEALAGGRAVLEHGLAGADDRRLVRTALAPSASPAGGALAVLHDVTVEHATRAELAALHALAVAVAGGADAEQIFTDVATHVRTLFGAESAAVVRIDPGDLGTFVGIARGDAPGRRPPWTIALRGTGAEQVVRTGRAAAVVRHDVSNPELRGIAGAPHGAQHYAASAPIELDGAIWGVLSILSGRPERTTPGVVERLGRFAELVSLAIASSASRRRLVDAAELDPLTGLANRRRFMARLELDAAAAVAEGSTLALALIDLDRFKALNDTHGHPVGDEALVAIGRALSAGARRGDLVARIGGEEFACILPGADLEPARRAAERLIARIGAIDLGVDWSLSASAGVAELAPGEDAGSLVARADAALYAAKAAGRGRALAA